MEQRLNHVLYSLGKVPAPSYEGQQLQVAIQEPLIEIEPDFTKRHAQCYKIVLLTAKRFEHSRGQFWLEWTIDLK